jgi:hypothetical protein
MSLRTPPATAVLAVVAVCLLGVSLGACEVDSTSGPSTSSPPPNPSDPPVSPHPGTSAPSQDPPPGGWAVPLRRLGFVNGPVDTFPVPSVGVVSVRVDQPNVVTLVLTTPGAQDVYAFYVRELSAAGFQVGRSEPSTATLSFSGHGWQGSVTGQGQASAVVLRPT